MDSKSSTSVNTQPAAGISLSAFDYVPSTRIIYGAGSLDRLGDLSTELGAKHVLLVTDKGLAEAGHEARAVASLENAQIQITIFDDVRPNPTTEDVERGLQVARNHQIDLIVGLGGGSSMDCAKGLNFLLTNGGQMQDYWGVGKASKPMLPMIAIPTTAGTGSEAQSFAVIAHPETHMKMACGDKKAACKIAILDPELTLTMPRSVTQVTGIDALSHAIETFVTKPRNEISQLFSRRAWSLLANSFPTVLETPNDLNARGKMQLGSHFAGAAIENSMLGATHALANPLSAHFDLTHGVAIGIMLPHVIRFNAELVGDHYTILAADIGLCEPHDPAGADLLAEHIQSLIAKAGAPTSLTECNVDPNLVEQLAEEAARQWTGNFNPRPVDQSSLRDLYECAF